MARANPPPSEFPVIEERYEEYAIGSVRLALIGHPTDGRAWIMSDYTLPIDR
ncbi:hypothetical protein [Halosolutus halophilus]|uniref:hypothetical protein n=1 Tax=Halosolutus halophilus TaxID=1552990 RepID=UPI002234FD99|nr:hypothetical protein [Halosolutus halophilus]